MSASLVSLVITDASGGDVSRLTSADAGVEFRFTFTFSEKIFMLSSGATFSGNISQFFDNIAAFSTGPEGSTTLVCRGFLKSGLTEDIASITIGLHSGWESADETTVDFAAVPATSASGVVVQGEMGTPPEITTGNGATASYTVGENGSSVEVIGISDDFNTEPGRVSYSLGGADSDLFMIDGATGRLSFKAAPNFEAPSDQDGDNNYDLTLTITDSIGQTDFQDITVTVEDRNDLPTGAVTVSGTADVDEVLTASNTLADEDGLGPISYQWQRGGVDILGAEEETYTLIQADAGAAITVEAIYTDSGGVNERVASAVVNVNNPPTSTLVITGNLAEDEMLIMSGSIGDLDGGVASAIFQWQRDGVDINGATSTHYTLTQADVGAAISMVVSYTDDRGTDERVVIATAGPVLNVNDLPTGAVNLSGLVAEDEVLTASNTLADEDGLGAISYQWQRDGIDLIGATGESYTLTQSDVGGAITVAASYTDGYGAEERIVSAATSAVANVNDLPTGVVTISGTVAEDEVLTASNTLADEDGLGAMSYQWQRDGVDIVGADGGTYTLTQVDVGAEITVAASYTDSYGAEERIMSAATEPVINVNDPPTGSVTLAGTARVGQTLSASNTLSDADGMGAISYQWLRNGEVIPGATEPAFTLSLADVGAAIAVRASYRDGQGTSERVLSASTEPVASNAASSGDDLLKGTSGKDVLEGGEGSDILVGEAGNDILVGDALDLFLPFPGLQVYLSYQAILGRAPDSEGFSYWSGLLQGALALPEFLGQLLASEEFLSVQSPVGDAAFVGQLYANLLGRSPSPEALTPWMDQFGEGASREEVAEAFIELPDVLEAMSEEASAYLSAISSLAGEFEQIFRLYQATLNRLPDPEGLEFWAEQLGNGLSFENAIEGFIRSEEFQGTYGALDHPSFVAQLYQNVLGREADDAGQAFWTRLLEDGLDRASVVAGFATSVELIEKSYPDFLAFMGGLQGDSFEGGAGDDILVGGLRADQFIFNATDAGKDLVVRFDPWDTIDLRGFGYADAEDALTHFQEIGGDSFFSDGDVYIHFANSPLSVFEDATFIF
ncbi:DUF4214 domain-containing protein [Sulfitobacter sp. NFXS29]|uniref:DUF4214 domain-containing protein n=1 Tax=Sulfitobacter sp. NFXS29 TaxID=2818438 RepID=UPI0032DED353